MALNQVIAKPVLQSEAHSMGRSGFTRKHLEKKDSNFFSLFLQINSRHLENLFWSLLLVHLFYGGMLKSTGL